MVWGLNPQLPAQQECHHDVERNDTSTPKPVARQSNLLYLFPYSEAVWRAAKLQNKDLSFRLALFIPTVSMNALHSANLFLFSRHHIPTNSVPPFSSYKYTHNSQFLQQLWWRANTWNVSFLTLYSGQFTLSTQLIIQNYPVIFSHWCSTSVSIETYPLYLHSSPALDMRYQKKKFLCLNR